MQESFDRLTEEARRAITLAREEARGFRHDFVGTEHLLLGLVREEEGIAARTLTRLGVELVRVRHSVELIIGRGEGAPAGDIVLTPRARKAVHLAGDEAHRLGSRAVGTAHMLLGLLREGEGIATSILESLGVHPGTVRSEVIAALVGVTPPMDLSEYRPAIARAWEYVTLHTLRLPDGVRVLAADGAQEPRTPPEGVPLAEVLRRLGGEGWELSGIDPTAAEDGSVYVLKRRRERDHARKP